MMDDQQKAADRCFIVEQRIEPDAIRAEETISFLRSRIEVLDESVGLLQDRLETMHQLDEKTAKFLGSAWTENTKLRVVVRTLVNGPPGRLTLVAGDHAIEWFDGLMTDARKALGQVARDEDAA